jgi:glycosyltransferase involved in cell wall biosynthesis
VRIAHVVTYVSEDGAFGGPVAVALAQTQELARRGHEVDLLAGWDGRACLPTTDVTYRLFPVRRIGPGFAGLVAPGLWSTLSRWGPHYDVVHVHLARDLITLGAARLTAARRRRLIVQSHGMIMPDQRTAARALDAVATRPVFAAAAAALVLTEIEQAGLTEVIAGIGGSPPILIPNGVPAPAGLVDQCRPGPPVVMFLARLHPRKRVLAFAEAARLLVESGSDAMFEIIGPDEGDLPELRNRIAADSLGERVIYRGAIGAGQAPDELSRAAVYVLPAVREVFPMTVLEALSVGTPVVLGRDCGIAPELARRGAATVTDGSPETLAAAVAELLQSDSLRARRIESGMRAVDEWFSIDAVASRLESIYRTGAESAMV